MAGYISSTERLLNLASSESTTKITVPGKDLIQNWWRNKKLFRQAKGERIQYHQTKLTTIYSQEMWEKKNLQNQPQTIKKMAIGTDISITTSNVNGLNAPTKDTDWLKGYKNKTHIYAVYKKPTSDLKTQIYWNERMEKYIPCKWEAKVSWRSNPWIRQNRH